MWPQLQPDQLRAFKTSTLLIAIATINKGFTFHLLTFLSAKLFEVEIIQDPRFVKICIQLG